MNYEVLHMEQRSTEWFEIRSNCITGTTAKHLLKKGKAEALTIVKEALRNSLKYPYVSKAALRGQELEPVARDLLNKKMSMEKEYQDVKFEEIGFVKRTDVDNAGCSPDGVYMENDKIKYLCEIKCFGEKHHLACSGKPDLSIEIQIQWCLWCTGAEACFFTQFNPDMNDERMTSDGKRHPEQVLFVTKILPDQDYFEAFDEKIREK